MKIISHKNYSIKNQLNLQNPRSHHVNLARQHNDTTTQQHNYENHHICQPHHW